MSGLRFICVLAVAAASPLLCLAEDSPPGPNIVRNGSFEEGWQSGPIGWGWTYNVGLALGFADAADGRNWADVYGAVYQDLPTIAGQGYHLRFALAGNLNITAQTVANVLWEGTSVGNVAWNPAGHDINHMGWVWADYDVTASDSITRLTFENPFEGDGSGRILRIDAVSVVPVPEPGVIALLAASAVWMVVRRRKQSLNLDWNKLRTNTENRRASVNARVLFLWLSLMLLAHDNALASPGVNIVSNGDFEVVDLAYSNIFPPWQFSHGLTGYVNEPGSAASGGNCVFIGGDFVAISHMSQEVNTEVGQTYEFSFYERGDEGHLSERTTILNVFFGDVEVGSFTRSNHQPGWNLHTYTVVANSAITRLDFQNASLDGGSLLARPGVDGVQLSVIPEPSVLALFAISALWMIARKRQ